MPRFLGNGAAATVCSEGRDCDHAEYPNRGHRHVQSAGKVRCLAGFVGEYVDRVAAAESIRFDSAAAGQFEQERRGNRGARRVVGQQRGELHSEHERERAVVAYEQLFDAV